MLQKKVSGQILVEFFQANILKWSWARRRFIRNPFPRISFPRISFEKDFWGMEYWEMGFGGMLLNRRAQESARLLLG